MKTEILTHSGAEQRGAGALGETLPGSTESLHVTSPSASVCGTSFCLNSLPCTSLVVLSNSAVLTLGGSPSLNLS